MTAAASIPAPSGGWNAKDSFDTMPAGDAVKMVNLIPRDGFVESRKGYSLFCNVGVTSAGVYGESIFSSQSGLFVGYGGQIIDITTGTPSVIFSSGQLAVTQWQTTRFQDKLIACCAEVSNPLYQPGQVIDSTNVATELVVTGPTGAFWGCNTFKGRVYYWQKDSRSFWYAQAGAFQGVLTEFDLSTQITTGGTLVMMLTYTLDAGDGVDDLAVFIFSTGETLVYQGDDPENSLRWSSSGRFQIGEPLGIRAHQKVGGTEIILTKDGYVDLAQALRNGRYSEESSYSNKIIGAAKEAARSYGDLFGWECLLYPAGNLFIVNVPQSAQTLTPDGEGNYFYSINSIQHVRNTSTGAWCKFEGIKANAFCVYNDQLYFLNSTDVFLADFGNSDNGSQISFECIPAFNHLGAKGRRKQVTLCSHITNFAYPEYIVKDGMSDYKVEYQNQVVASDFSPGAFWDLADWDETFWASEEEELIQTTEGWSDISAFGYAVTVSLRIILNGFAFKWYATNYIYRPAGVI